MTNFWRKHRSAGTLLTVAGTLVMAALFTLYAERFDHSILYYYGASPELPGGTAIPVWNPLRNRKDEANAEWLIRDLRTNQCELIVRDRLREDPIRICPVLRGRTKVSLIWLDPERREGRSEGSRRLIYDLPESRARLVVYFRNSDVGWGVDTVSLLR
jgi:hypothetical protein